MQDGKQNPSLLSKKQKLYPKKNLYEFFNTFKIDEENKDSSDIEEGYNLDECENYADADDEYNSLRANNFKVLGNNDNDDDNSSSNSEISDEEVISNKNTLKTALKTLNSFKTLKQKRPRERSYDGFILNFLERKHTLQMNYDQNELW